MSKFKNCPFCGEDDLRISGPFDIDDNREYRVTVTCEVCDCRMWYGVGYRQFINLGGRSPASKASDFMFAELTKKWNTRNDYAIRIDLTGEVTPASPGSPPPKSP